MGLSPDDVSDGVEGMSDMGLSPESNAALNDFVKGKISGAMWKQLMKALKELARKQKDKCVKAMEKTVQNLINKNFKQLEDALMQKITEAVEAASRICGMERLAKAGDEKLKQIWKTMDPKVAKVEDTMDLMVIKTIKPRVDKCRETVTTA